MRTLYIGLDESNHGRTPEIIVAVASLIQSDASEVLTKCKKRMREKELRQFLTHPQRDYRFTKMSEESKVVGYGQFVSCGPLLINELLEKTENIDRLEIMIDGDVKKRDMSEIGKRVSATRKSREIGEFGIMPYPKYTYLAQASGYKYPLLLIAADSLAHYIFRREEFMEKIGATQKRVETK